MLIVLFGLEMCFVATALTAKHLTQRQLSDHVGGDGNGSTIVVIMDKDLWSQHMSTVAVAFAIAEAVRNFQNQP